MSIPYSSSAGGGGATFFYYCLGALVSAGLLWAACGAPDPDETDTDPKNSETFLPLRALATALSNPAETVTPEAWRTAVNDAWLTSAPDPDKTKAA
jgi:hypothetical protein